MERLKYINENKISVYVIGGAFFLSLVVGFISGNPAGIVMMRAFLSALLFGIIFHGGIYIIRRYIPELAKLSESVAEAEEKGTTDEAARIAGKIIDYQVGENEEGISFDRAMGNIPEEGGTEVHIAEGEGEKRTGGEDLSVGKTEETVGLEDVSLSDLPSLENLLEDEEEVSQEGEAKDHEVIRESSSTFSDYIKIGDAHIPYEPKALAKAVKKVMKEDESR